MLLIAPHSVYGNGDRDYEVSLSDPYFMGFATFSEVEALIAEGGDVNTTLGGPTSLQSAAFRNSDPEITRLLLKHGADVHVTNSFGGTPLHYAAASDPKIIRILLQYGADIMPKVMMGRLLPIQFTNLVTNIEQAVVRLEMIT